LSQVNGKRLKVVCGSNTSYLEDSAWVGEKTPLTLCEVRVSSKRIVKPNIGGLELAEALNRVLPFTATEDTRPILQCVNFVASEGKLTLASADGFRLAVVKLDFDGEGKVLIARDELAGNINKRPVFKEAMADGLEQKYDVLVVHKVDRFSRLLQKLTSKWRG